MSKGRKPKPAGLRHAQGNPGRRPIPKEAPEAVAEGSALAHAAAPGDGTTMPFVSLGDLAREAYKIVRGQLRQLNFVRDSDDSLLLRYADMLAQYWSNSAYVTANGSAYDCPMTNGGTMRRTRPEFLQMMMASKRLESMEDRLGLSPVARQQYLQRLMVLGGQQPSLPGMPSSGDGDAKAPGLVPPAPEQRGPVGFVRRDALN